MPTRSTLTAIAGFISPLPIFLMGLGNLLTEDRYRIPWTEILIWSGLPFAGLLVTVLLLRNDSSKARVLGIVSLGPVALAWLAACAFGLFILAVSDDPAWFH